MDLTTRAKDVSQGLQQNGLTIPSYIHYFLTMTRTTNDSSRCAQDSLAEKAVRMCEDLYHFLPSQSHVVSWVAGVAKSEYPVAIQLSELCVAHWKFWFDCYDSVFQCFYFLYDRWDITQTVKLQSLLTLKSAPVAVSDVTLTALIPKHSTISAAFLSPRIFRSVTRIWTLSSPCFTRSLQPHMYVIVPKINMNKQICGHQFSGPLLNILVKDMN